MNAEQSVLVTFDDHAGTMTAYSGRYRDWRFTAEQRGAGDTVVGECAATGKVVRRTLPRNRSSWKSFSSADMKSTLGVAVPFSVINLLAVPLMAVDRGSEVDTKHYEANNRFGRTSANTGYVLHVMGMAAQLVADGKWWLVQASAPHHNLLGSALPVQQAQRR